MTLSKKNAYNLLDTRGLDGPIKRVRVHTTLSPEMISAILKPVLIKNLGCTINEKNLLKWLKSFFGNHTFRVPSKNKILKN